MKKVLLSLFVVSVSISLSAQEWVKMMQDPNANFYDVQAAFNAYWEGKEPTRGHGWKQFKRWEHFMEARVYPTGDPIPSQPYYDAWQMAKLADRNSSLAKDNSEWTPLGPTSWLSQGWNPGLGRVNMMVKHPTDDNILFVGTPAGGLWKSEDAGSTWTPLTDNLPSIGVSGLAIHPENPDIMFMATGDGDGGNTYSLGVLKTSNGGTSWESTGLTNQVSQNLRGSKIVMHPTNFDTLWVATTAGLYSSFNGGDNWSLKIDGNIRDIELNTENPDIVYASGNKFYRSADGGNNFDEITDGVPGTALTNRIAIAVTEANSDFVYMVAVSTEEGDFEGLYQSTDGGLTFSQKSDSPNILSYPETGNGDSGQGWYDLAISASHTDANQIFVGGINVWRSNNGGSNWQIVSHWTYPSNIGYTHADIHSLDHYNGKLYCGSDGGIFVSSNEGNTWTDLSEGLQISQFNRIAISTTDANVILTASQDNGTNLFSNSTTYTHLLGGDGNMAAIDYNNDQIMYAAYPGGDFRKSTNGGQNFSGFNNGLDENGAWVTPLEFHPTNPDILFAGFENVFKNTNGTWTQLGVMPGSGTLRSLKVAPSEPNTIYTATQGNLYKTTDGGLNWSNVSGQLPSSNITDIAIDPENPERVWVTFSGYEDNSKVYFSSNGGTNWANYSTNLPNLPVNCITYQVGSNDGLYVGTDAGVYYINSQATEWNAYNEGLPNVIVNQIVLHYQTNEMYLATYGRGVWTNAFFDASNILPSAEFTSDVQIICEDQSVAFSNSSLNSSADIHWTFEGGIPEESTDPIAVVTYPSEGLYATKLLVTNENGTDSIIKMDYITVQSLTGIEAPLQEGFEDIASLTEASWITVDEDTFNEWELNNAVGYESDQSAWLSNFGNAPLNEDLLWSNTYDLSGLDTVIVTFRVANARRLNSGTERIKVEISTDCGESWDYKKLFTSPDFALADPTDEPYIPAGPEEWSLLSVDNIEADELTENFRIRFVFRSNGGNNVYVDNINIDMPLVDNVGEVSGYKYEAKLFPNPIVDQTTTFEITLDQTLKSSIVMTDILGKRVATLWNGTAIAGKNSIALSIPELASGFYTLQLLSTDGSIQSSTPLVIN